MKLSLKCVLNHFGSFVHRKGCVFVCVSATFSFKGIVILQDIATKIMSFSQQRPRAVCILSASGTVSAVTLRQPAASGSTVTYEVEPFANTHLFFFLCFV